MTTAFQVTFDAADPDKLARFWAEVLGYRLQPPPPGFDTWEDWLRENNVPEDKWNEMSAAVDPEGEGPRLFFQRVPEPKTAKNRVHLDVNAGGPKGTPDEERAANVEKAVERAIAAGATKVEAREGFGGERWVVLLDPEGNEFCMQ